MNTELQDFLGRNVTLLSSNTGAQNAQLLRNAADECLNAEAIDGIQRSVLVDPCDVKVDFSVAGAYTAGALRIEALQPGTVKFRHELGGQVYANDLTGDAVGPHAILGFANVVHPNVSATDANAFISRVAVSPANSLLYQAGDAVNIQSENTRTYYNNSPYNYGVNPINFAGESAIVEAVDTSAGYVYIRGVLRLSSLMSTNPVMRRMTRKSGSLFKGIIVDTVAGTDDDVLASKDTTGFGVPLIYNFGTLRPVVEDVIVRRGYHAAIMMRTCIMPEADRNKIVLDPLNLYRFGYGVVLDAMCLNGKVRGNRMERCRHAFTIDTYKVLSATYSAANWALYGDCKGSFIDGNMSIGNGGAAFDTHEGSLDTVFGTNVAFDATRPAANPTNSSSPSLYQLRGRNDIVIGGASMGNLQGIVVGSTGVTHEPLPGEGTSPGNVNAKVSISSPVFSHEEHNNSINAAISLIGSSSPSATPTDVDIVAPNMQRCSRAITVMAGVTGRVNVQGGILNAYDSTIDVRGNAKITLNGTTLDCSGKRGSEKLINVDGSVSSACEINLVNVAVRPGSSSTPGEVVTVASGSSPVIRHKDVVNLDPTKTLALTGGAGTPTVTAMSNVA